MTDPAKRIMWTSQSTDNAMLDRIRSKSEAMRGLYVHGIHPDVAAIVHDEIGRYKVGGPMPITFDLSPHSGQVTVFLRTVDRDDPRKHVEFSKSENLPMWLRFHAGMASGWNGDEAAIRKAVQDLLHILAKAAYLHELGEWFTRDGVRVRDPHADGEP